MCAAPVAAADAALSISRMRTDFCKNRPFVLVTGCDRGAAGQRKHEYHWQRSRTRQPLPIMRWPLQLHARVRRVVMTAGERGARELQTGFQMMSSVSSCKLSRRAALLVTRLASIESVASRLPRLMAWCSVVKFDLSGRGISSEGFKILARVLGQCPSLATLNLGCNHIGDEGAGSLAWVQGQCCSLVELNLGGNDIGDHGIAMILSCPRLKPVYGFVRKKLLSYRASILIQRTRLTASVRVQRKPDDRRVDSWEKEIQPFPCVWCRCHVLQPTQSSPHRTG